MKNVKRFDEFVNESALNEMAYRGSFVKTSRKPADIEKELTDIVDKHANKAETETKLRKDEALEWDAVIRPIWEKYLPAGTTMLSPRDQYLAKNSYPNVYDKKTGNEICSFNLDSQRYGMTKLDEILKGMYINYSSSWMYLDSDGITKLQQLGEIAKIFGSAKSPFYKEWWSAATTINDKYKALFAELNDDGSKYSLAKIGNDLTSEYLSASFNEIFKVGAKFETEEGFEVGKDRRGRWGQRVKSFTVEKIKGKNADVRYVYVGYQEELIENTATWSIASIFEAWSTYTKEGKAVESKFTKLSSY